MWKIQPGQKKELLVACYSLLVKGKAGVGAQCPAKCWMPLRPQRNQQAVFGIIPLTSILGFNKLGLDLPVIFINSEQEGFLCWFGEK
jgi:hypothetical protein